MVLVGQEPARLAFSPEPPWPIVVRSTYLRSLPQTVVYQPGQDFLADDAGRIWRAPNSRIPDFHTNLLFGKEDFRHDQFPGYGNARSSFTWDYTHREKFRVRPAKREFSATMLPKTHNDSSPANRSASWLLATASPLLATRPRETDLLGTLGGRASPEISHATIEAINGATARQHRAGPGAAFGEGDRTKAGFVYRLRHERSQSRRLRRAAAGVYGKPAQTGGPRGYRVGAEVVLFSAFPPIPSGTSALTIWRLRCRDETRGPRAALRLADVYQLC